VVGCYIVIACIALVKTHVLRIVWLQPLREFLPMMIKGFWEVYPGRFWPGPLKLLGYPLTVLFIGMVVAVFVAFQP
jgi:hypothetical protein